MDSINKFLEKYKLIQYHEFELDISKEEFLKVFNLNIEYDEVSRFLQMKPDILLSWKKEYVGKIKNDQFEIRKIRKLYPFFINRSIVNGEMNELGDKLLLKIKIYYFNNFEFFCLFSLNILLFILIIILLCCSAINFIIVFLIYIYGITIYSIIFARFSVNRMKKNIESDFKRYVEMYKSEKLNNPQ